MLLLKLPPGDRFKTFEKLDFLTFVLFAPGVALLCAVLSLGATVWWLEAALDRLGAGRLDRADPRRVLAIEHNRSNPLLNTRWLGSGAIVRLVLVLMLIRIVLSEQTTGAVGLMQALGMGNDQLHTLFIVCWGPPLPASE